jgi:HEAT repeat protein
LLECLSDGDPDVRGMAITGLSQIGGPDIVGALQRTMQDGARNNANTRIAVAETLGFLKRPEGLPTVIALSSDRDPAVRQAAAIALGQIGGPRAIKALQPLLADPAPNVRNIARRVLGFASGGR